MVVFTCNYCGESVKKPSVEKHYNTKCNGKKKNVSCMDCQKDFDENYNSHTKCISELQKYSGKDYVPRENQNKGEKKQESWVSTIRGVLDSSEYNLDAKTRSAFQTLQNYDNIPQKKAKFLNFVSNSVRIPRQTVENVWNILEKEQQKMKQARQLELEAAKKEKQLNGKKEKNSENGDNEEQQKKKKKRKTDVEDDEVSVQNGKREKKQKNGSTHEDEPVAKKQKESDDAIETDANQFSWQEEFNNVLTKNPEGIALDKMKKKILKKYKSQFTEELTEEQLNNFEKKFNKKLKKNNLLTLEDNIVKAVTSEIKAEEQNGTEVAQVAVENGFNKRKQKNAKTDEDEPKSKKQKETNGVSETDEYQFCWEDEFENILNKHGDGIELEKMKKKILKKYKTKFNEDLTERQLLGFEKKFNKKLKQNNFLKLEDNIVKAVS